MPDTGGALAAPTALVIAAQAALGSPRWENL